MLTEAINFKIYLKRLSDKPNFSIFIYVVVFIAKLIQNMV
jgi:hypothetical protein